MSKRVFGEAVTSIDIERLRPDPGATVFVRLCEALITKAITEHLGHGIVPNVAEPINVPDGGVDAELTVPAGEHVTEKGGLVGRGRTVYQFKYRDTSRADASAIRSKLVRKLTDEFPRVAPYCDRYVLMLNIRLSPAQRRKIEDALIASFPAFAGRPLVVWGAGELATALNANPPVRHMFFADGALGTLELAHDDLRRTYATIGWPSFVGRERETRAILDFLSASDTSVLQVVGPRYSGKTRLVIEALRRSGRFVVWADGPDVLGLAHFRDLDEPNGSTVLVVDHCEGEEAHRIFEWARSRRWLKTIAITVGEGWGEHADLVGCPIVRVTGLPAEATRQLVANIVPGVPFARQSWVYEASEGLPGVALHLAAAMRHVRESSGLASPPENALSELPQQLEREFVQVASPAERRALEVASLMPLVGVQGPRQKEIEALCQALGVRADEVTAALPNLERRGLVRRRGRFVETIPPILADYLAGRALSNPSVDLAAMALMLPRPQFRRFLERVRQVRGADVSGSIDAILKSSEWFGDLAALARNAEVIELLVPSRSGVALDVITSVIESTAVEDLRSVLQGEPRRAIVRALERATLRTETFAHATRLLLALAEAENETWDNNAAGVFASRFHWRHPEVSAPFLVRLTVLKEAAVSQAVERRRLVAGACGAAFKERQTFRLTSSADPEVPEEPLRATWGEAAKYARGILGILEQLITDSSPEVLTIARQSLLRGCEWFLRLAAATEGHYGLGARTISLLEHSGRDAASAEDRAAVSESIDRLERTIASRALAASNDISQPVVDLFRLLREARAELSTMESLRDRLWKWLGPGSWRARRATDEAEAALEGIARELLASPEALRTHVAWLTGTEAKGAAPLMSRIGSLDRGGVAYEILLSVGEGLWWSTAFAQYLYGWRGMETAAANALDHLITTQPTLGSRLVDSITELARLDGSARTAERVLRLVAEAESERSSIATSLAWSLRWGELDAEDVDRLFKGLDDGTAIVRRSLVSALAARHSAAGHLSHAPRDIAWQLLEETFAASEGVLKHDWDSLAASLGEGEPERLLALVEVILREPELDTSRLDHEVPQLWEVLVSGHREKLLEALLRRAMDRKAPAWIDATLEALIDPRRDRALISDVIDRLGLEAARTISLALDAEAPGFWEVARGLIAEYGDDPIVAERLTTAVTSGMWTGSALELIDMRRQVVMGLLQDPDERVRGWAQRVEGYLSEWRMKAEREQDEEWIWDAKLRRIETEQLVHSADQAERLWAIGRLLKDAPERRVRELLTPTEILDVLPHLPQLDQMTRNKWERWARYHVTNLS